MKAKNGFWDSAIMVGCCELEMTGNDLLHKWNQVKKRRLTIGRLGITYLEFNIVR